MLAVRPVFDPAVQQRLYRAVLDATGYAGRVRRLEGLDGDPGWLGVLATLADESTPVCDRDGLLASDDARMIGAPPSPAGSAAFIVARGDRPAADIEPSVGTLGRPEFGATILLAVGSVGHPASGLSLTMRGPGIDGSIDLVADGLDPSWIERRAWWCREFPMGVDLYLCDGSGRIAAIPRTSVVTMGGRA